MPRLEAARHDRDAAPTGTRRRPGAPPCRSGYASDVGRAPRTRIRWSRDRAVCHNVVWGAEPPQVGDRARGRFCGYSETAINDFLSSFPYVQEMPDASA
ncbi:DUF6302 family protein [Streptomyces lavendulocolor]|uniref:DUF6302 family protein n=1 Tax=Streptomyces lavendulocolor TaxID=67316 RepID=A0ABV2W211_9ACTN